MASSQDWLNIAQYFEDIRDDIRALKARGVDPNRGIVTVRPVLYSECSGGYENFSNTDIGDIVTKLQIGAAMIAIDIDAVQQELDNPTDIKSDIDQLKG